MAVIFAQIRDNQPYGLKLRLNGVDIPASGEGLAVTPGWYDVAIYSPFAVINDPTQIDYSSSYYYLDDGETTVPWGMNVIDSQTIKILVPN